MLAESDGAVRLHVNHPDRPAVAPDPTGPMTWLAVVALNSSRTPGEPAGLAGASDDTNW
jgi:hypothetical protein